MECCVHIVQKDEPITPFTTTEWEKIMKSYVNLLSFSHVSINTLEIWKCSRVIPLHKGGDPLEINNYRLISIICSIAKIFE